MSKIPSVFRDVYNSPYSRRDTRLDLYKSTKESLDFVQRLKLLQKLPVHQGCVNTICWNDTGEYILSGSDDQQLCITSGNSYKLVTSLRTRHRANIFSAKFLPNTNDRKIISCSGDGLIIYTELERPEDNFKNCFNCHVGTAYKIVTVPNDPNTFLSCGEDGTVRWFDLRMKTQCTTEDCKEDTLINCQRPVTALAVDPIFPYQLAIGCCDSSVRIYDRRMLGTKATGNFTAQSYQGLVTKFTVPEFEGKSHRITSLVYSSDSKEVLVSYSSEYLYLFRIKGEETTPGVTFGPGLGGGREGKKDGLEPPPPMKRLRLRGDWSDTGPNARPERELRDAGQQRSLHANLMHHVSDVLTRMINDPTRQNRTAPLAPRLRSVNMIRAAQEAVSVPASEPCQCPSRAAASTPPNPSIPVDDGTTPPLPAVPASTGIDTDSESVNIEAASCSGDVECAGVASEEVPNDRLASKSERQNPGIEKVENFELLQSVEAPLGTQNAGDSEDLPLSDEEMPQEDRSGPSEIDKTGSQVENGHSISLTSSSDSRVLNRDDHLAGNSLGESSSTREVADDAGEESTTRRGAQLRVRKIGISGPSTWVTTRVTSADSEADNSDDTGENSDSDPELPELEYNPEQPAPEQQSRARSTSPFDILRSMDEALRRQEEEREKEDKFLLHLPQPILLQKFTGHRNARTMIKEANFWGENYVMSGSDCGHVFIWNRHTAELVMIMEADDHVVNCLQPHPYDPVLATSGIDYDIKLWAPGNEEPNFEEKMAEEIMGRNEVMLEETRDTITVPASFMIRMLASFNHLRQGGIFARWRQTLRRDPPTGSE